MQIELNLSSCRHLHSFANSSPFSCSHSLFVSLTPSLLYKGFCLFSVRQIKLSSKKRLSETDSKKKKWQKKRGGRNMEKWQRWENTQQRRTERQGRILAKGGERKEKQYERMKKTCVQKENVKNHRDEKREKGWIQQSQGKIRGLWDRKEGRELEEIGGRNKSKYHKETKEHNKCD